MLETSEGVTVSPKKGEKIFQVEEKIRVPSLDSPRIAAF